MRTLRAVRATAEDARATKLYRRPGAGHAPGDQAGSILARGAYGRDALSATLMSAALTRALHAPTGRPPLARTKRLVAGRARLALSLRAPRVLRAGACSTAEVAVPNEGDVVAPATCPRAVGVRQRWLTEGGRPRLDGWIVGSRASAQIAATLVHA